MMLKKLLECPDPRLRQVCDEVKTIDSYVLDLIQEMISIVRKSSMTFKGKEFKCVGLAAPQIGEMVRVFVVETPNFSLAAINPSIIKASHPIRVLEACLSLPGRLFLVERPKINKFRFLAPDGTMRAMKLHDSSAQEVMHEIDHLNGIMIDEIAIRELHDF